VRDLQYHQREEVQVLGRAFDADGLGDDRDAALHEPMQDDLADRPAVLEMTV